METKTNNYEDIVNGPNALRREQLCRRDYMIETALRLGGWVLMALILAVNLAVKAF